LLALTRNRRLAEVLVSPRDLRMSRLVAPPPVAGMPLPRRSRRKRFTGRSRNRIQEAQSR